MQNFALTLVTSVTFAPVKAIGFRARVAVQCPPEDVNY